MKKLCRKCGKAFRGMGAVCDCIMEATNTDRNGQIGIFQVERAESEWEEFCSAIDEVLNVTTDRAVPESDLLRWRQERCKSRKTFDDWGGLGALHRDFTAWRGEQYTVASFATAIQDAGYAVSRGMVSRLVLKEDYGHLQVRSQEA